MTWLDFIFALIIGASVVAGFSRGLIKIGITAGQIGKQLLEGEPRIMTHAGLSNQ